MTKKQEKKEAILERASAVLLELGPAKVTLDDIARRAGMSKTSLYYYFKSRNELVYAIMCRELEHGIEFIERAIEAQVTAEGKLHALVYTMHRFIFDKARCIHLDYIKGTATGMYKFEQILFNQALERILENILHEGSDSGEFRPINDPCTVSRLIISSVAGLYYAFLLYNHDEHVKETYKEMVNLFLVGLKPNQREGNTILEGYLHRNA